MKALLLLLSIPLWAQQQTPNLGLNLPAPNQTGWNQLINQNFSTLDSYLGGTLAIPSLKVTNAGVFSGAQMNEYDQSLINGCSPLAEFQANQGNTNYSTDGLTGCVSVPATATNHQQNAVAGYINNSVSTVETGGAVGGYFAGRALVSGPGGGNGNGTWGLNSMVSDSPGITSTQLISTEVDVDIYGSPVRAWGILVSGGMGAGGVVPPFGSGAGIEIRAPSFASGNNHPWPVGLELPDGSGAIGVYVGAAANGNSQLSMPVEFVGRDSGGTQHTVNLQASTAGVLTVTGNPFRVGNVVTFSALPACAAGTEGTMNPVSDSTTATWGATITGSGTNHVLAYCDGTNWTVAAK